MIDALITLIGEENKGTGDTRQLQDQLLQQFLIPGTKQIRNRINEIEDAEFYQKCIGFLDAYLELEQGLFENETEAVH
jgi:TorA maturation chaperone TorD